MQLGVLLIEPDSDLRYWVGRLLERSQDFTLRASYSQGDDLERMAERVTPELILLDSKTMFDLDPGIIARLKSRQPAPFVALAGFADEKSQEKLTYASGADGYFDKSRAPQSLHRIRQSILACMGGGAVDPAHG